jgi:Rrf2 family nitric oxide-sensitive transcriptional repressor
VVIDTLGTKARVLAGAFDTRRGVKPRIPMKFGICGTTFVIHNRHRQCIFCLIALEPTMRLTSFTDFALRALMRLAGEPERLFTTEEIAREFAISRNHLMKVVGELSAAGFITTQRGVGGGFRLARQPDAITIGEIVRRLEARHALVECFRADGGLCVLTPKCQLKRKLAAAQEVFLAELDKTRLSECVYPMRGRK